MEFYKYDKNYKLNDCTVQLENVQILELNENCYEFEQKPKKLNYFKEPKLTSYPLNLNEGFEKYIFRNKDVLYGNALSTVLKWSIKEANNRQNENEYTIFTHRQALIKIMNSLKIINSKFFNWRMYVTKFDNNLYMYCENDENLDNELDKRYSYHYKLQQMLFSDSPYSEPKTDEAVDTNIRLNGVYRCQLGKFNLIYSAEVQGIISDMEIKDVNTDLNQFCFVNTKVYAKKNKVIFPHQKFERYFNNKLAKIDASYFAFRNDEGYIHDPIQKINTADLSKNKHWNPKVYEQFLYDFISLIAEKMSTINSLETTYEFIYKADEKKVYYKVHEGKTDKSFIAEDYIKHVEKNKKLKEFLSV